MKTNQNPRITILKSIASAALVATLFGNASPAAATGSTSGGQGTETEQMSGTAGQAPAQLTVEEVLGVIEETNRSEIAQSRVAVARAQSDLLRVYALRLGRDRIALRALGTAFVSAREMLPEESRTSRAVGTRSDEIIESLNNASDAEFDAAYLDNQIRENRFALRLIDASEPCRETAEQGLGGEETQRSICVRFGMSLGGETDTSADSEIQSLSDAQKFLALARAHVVSHLLEALWLRNQLVTTTMDATP